MSAAAAWLVLTVPSVAFACPGCFTANEANRIAYIVTFVFLTVLPLLMLGFGVYYLRRKVRENEAATDATVGRGSG